MRGWRSFARLRDQRYLKRMTPASAIAGVHPYGGTDAREQRMVRINLIEFEADRQTLDHLDPIAGRVLRRQHRKNRSSARTHADNMGLDCAMRINIDHD